MKKVAFYVGGCSGSASPESARHEFGNLTTSFGVLTGNEGIFIDNGSGIARVSSFLLENKVTAVYGLQTHFHNDHIQGIQNNKLLFIPKMVKGIYAPKLCSRSFSDIFKEDFDKSKWPVCPEDFGITTKINDYTPGEVLTTSCVVETLLQNHPVDGSVAYRLGTEHGDIVISTDSEPVDEHVQKMADFITGSSLFYVDVQYRDSEYVGEAGICGNKPMPRIGWGHGTPKAIFNVLTKCKTVPKVILIGHHDPQRTPGDLFVFEKEVKDLLSYFNCSVRFAREGDHVEL